MSSLRPRMEPSVSVSAMWGSYHDCGDIVELTIETRAYIPQYTTFSKHMDGHIMIHDHCFSRIGIWLMFFLIFIVSIELTTSIYFYLFPPTKVLRIP